MGTRATGSASKGRIVVTGMIAQYPLGGVAWDYVQYPVGLARLGYDVFYLENTGRWPYNPTEGGVVADLSTSAVSSASEFNTRYLQDVMRRFGLGERWACKFPWQDEWFGPVAARRAEILASADLMINVSGALAPLDTDCRQVKRLAYVDSDPVFTQVKLARGQNDFAAFVDSHDVHFSFGEALSASPTPETGHTWLPTRQPVLIDEWSTTEPAGDTFTTIMNWTSYKPVKHAGTTYGQKDVELSRFLELPRLVAPIELELAINAGKTRRTPRELLVHRGWKLADPLVACADLDAYRAYVQGSKAEWSVAKHGYVAGRSGWFSCRSACYLAAGRPAVVQDTGFGDVLPVGHGVVAFSTPEEAAASVRDVNDRYGEHAAAAREIAREYFDAGTVLSRLVELALASRTVPA
jgi:hypothetical protein